jgi:signal transduction histidine kinase
MVRPTLKILIADDDEGDRLQVIRSLRQSELLCECTETANIQGALEACNRRTFDCAIVDYQMPGDDGLHGIVALHKRFPYLCIVMASGQGDETVATEAMKRGASDYIAKKHINSNSLTHVIESAIEKTALRRKVAGQQEELQNFARVLVHDLRAPMRSIQGFVRIIERNIGKGDTKTLSEFCGLVSDAVVRMDALIDTLHQYTKMDERVPFVPVEMQHVLNDTLSNLKHSIDGRGARVTHGNLPTVIGSAPQLAQLLQNLIGNGIKYCEADIPSIHIAAEAHDKDAWLFTVKDNGIGIPEEYYESAFDAFRRLPGADTYEGTGLGLATCKKIVARHGGIIGCSSEPGKGTSFFFTLPGTAVVAREFR